MRNNYSSFWKPVLDKIAATILLLVLLPLFLLIALAVRCSSRGPVLFVQIRVGADERTFRMLKFRTMRSLSDKQIQIEAGSLQDHGYLLKPAEDPRVTKLGMLLRRYSLDELPQLINVLRGEMSIVGPRPLLPFMFTDRSDQRRIRCQVRPGLTGRWQVEARDACTCLEDMWEYDLEYLRRVSLREDLNVVLRTVPTVLSGKGAR